MKTQLHWYFE